MKTIVILCIEDGHLTQSLNMTLVKEVDRMDLFSDFSDVAVAHQQKACAPAAGMIKLEPITTQLSKPRFA